MNIQTVVNTLNRAFVADPEAIEALTEYRVPCTLELVDDPSVVVAELQDGVDSYPAVGALGLINGILDDLLGQRIVSVFDDTDVNGNKLPEGQWRMTGFDVYQGVHYTPNS